MAIKRVVSMDVSTDAGEKSKLKARFKDKMSSANTVAELKKCINILARHVFNESDGE